MRVLKMACCLKMAKMSGTLEATEKGMEDTKTPRKFGWSVKK
jgi:hypothetical protein